MVCIYTMMKYDKEAVPNPTKVKIDFDKLKEIVGEDSMSNKKMDIYVYGFDASLPWIIVKPTKIEHVQKILCYANKEGIPVIPIGMGTHTTGYEIPLHGGIILSLKKMNNILKVSPEDASCRVEPGVVDTELNSVLETYGFFYPPTPPASDATTIGGELASNAFGVRSAKYGGVRDYVLGMKVVLADGDLLTLGSNTYAGPNGYQLERLMVGSEGTLGVIVEATLKIIPLPKFRALGVVKFKKLEEAGEAISNIVSAGIVPSMCELIDNVGVDALNKSFEIGLPEVEAVLLFEVDGQVKELINYEVEKIKEICEKNGGFGFEIGRTKEDRERIYLIRKRLFGALARYKKGLIPTALINDVMVPISRVASCMSKIQSLAKENNLLVSVLAHCGSGILRTVLLIEPHKEFIRDAGNLACEIYDYIDKIGGRVPTSVSGKKKLLYMVKEIKKIFDPRNILNPHKLIHMPIEEVTHARVRQPVIV